MAIDSNWLVQKFDYTTKKLEWSGGDPVYWDTDDIDAFVDSDLGDDSTGDGSASAPWATLAKVKASGAAYWGTGKVVMIRGYFDEVFSINVAARIVGAGGGLLGKAVFGGTITLANITNTVVENLFVLVTTGYWNNALNHNFYDYNCIYYAVPFNSSTNYHYSSYHYSYFSIFYNCIIRKTSGGNYQHLHKQYGNNNTYYNCTKLSYSYVYFYGNNNHCNNTIVNTVYGSNCITNTNGAYLDVANYNFNFLNTSPLYHTGTYNPDTDNYNHVGAGTEGNNLDATDDELNDDVDATYTNVEKSGTEIYRIDVGSDGIIESGVVDLGAVRTRVVMNMNYTYEEFGGVVYRRIQETSGLTVTQIFDCIIQYGETLADVASCPELLVEYGKLITVSGTGASRYGNADISNFDPTDMIAIDSLYIRYISFKLRLKTGS